MVIVAFCLSFLLKAYHGCTNLPRLRGRKRPTPVFSRFLFFPSWSLYRGKFEKEEAIKNQRRERDTFLPPLQIWKLSWREADTRKTSKRNFFLRVGRIIKISNYPDNKSLVIETVITKKEKKREGKERDWKLTKFLNESDRSTREK